MTKLALDHPPPKQSSTINHSAPLLTGEPWTCPLHVMWETAAIRLTIHSHTIQTLFYMHPKWYSSLCCTSKPLILRLLTHTNTSDPRDLSPIAAAVSEADPWTRAGIFHRPAFIKRIIKAHREPGSSRPGWGQGWHHYPKNTADGGGRALWCDSFWTRSLKQPAFIHYGCVVCWAFVSGYTSLRLKSRARMKGGESVRFRRVTVTEWENEEKVSC